jgi:hypothetical protein
MLKCGFTVTRSKNPLSKKLEELLFLAAASVRFRDPDDGVALSKPEPIPDAARLITSARAYVEITLPIAVKYCCNRLKEFETLKTMPVKDAKVHIERYTKAIRNALYILRDVRDHRMPENTMRDFELHSLRISYPSLSNAQIAIKYNSAHPNGPINEGTAKQAISRENVRREKLRSLGVALGKRHQVVSQLPMEEQFEALPTCDFVCST